MCQCTSLVGFVVVVFFFGQWRHIEVKKIAFEVALFWRGLLNHSSVKMCYPIIKHLHSAFMKFVFVVFLC